MLIRPPFQPHESPREGLQPNHIRSIRLHSTAVVHGGIRFGSGKWADEKRRTPRTDRLKTFQNFTMARFAGDLNLLVFSMSEVVLYCHFGDELALAANGISNVIYTNQWFDYPPSFRRYLVLAIRRSQHPAEIVGLKMIPCSMKSFKSVRIRSVLRKFLEIWCFVSSVAADEFGRKCFYGSQIGYMKETTYVFTSLKSTGWATNATPATSCISLEINHCRQ